MELDTSTFNSIATPLLKDIAKHFPNAFDTFPDSNLSDDETRSHSAVIRFLKSEGFIRQDATDGDFMTLTAKGLELFGCDIKQEISRSFFPTTTVGL